MNPPRDGDGSRFCRGSIGQYAADANGRPATNPDRQALYAAGSRELYISADELGYARPGFYITVNSITIPDDRRPVVDYFFTDDLDQPLVPNRTEETHG